MRCTSTRPEQAESARDVRGRYLAGGACRVALTLALVVGAASSSWAERDRDPPLVESFEAAPGLLVGSVTRVERVAHAGWVAAVAVERVLRSRDESTKAPKSIEVAWEEAAPSLPSRFSVGRRLLLAIEPLSTASIWKQRVPDRERRASLYSVAAKGRAYLERPSGEELSDLEHYLALGDDARRGNAGVVYLVALAARSQPRLALSGIAQLARLREFSQQLGPDEARGLCDALMREGRLPGQDRGAAEGDVGEAALALIERFRPAALRPVLQSRITALSQRAPAVLYAALGALDGEIPDSVALELLASKSQDHRVAAARWTGGVQGREQLRQLLRTDPAPSVRAAAVSRLLQLEGGEALPDAVRCLDDPAGSVRLAAARSIAKIGPEALPELEYMVDSGSEDGVKGAIVTLSLMGGAAHEMLAEISEHHADKGIRALAGIAIGRPLGHVH